MTNRAKKQLYDRNTGSLFFSLPFALQSPKRYQIKGEIFYKYDTASEQACNTLDINLNMTQQA
ncbi:hypothetical protein OBV_42450 [Oscillibacter valericigenes Sjm18-20]|nr:hypothetical protein OBV_42450 [Oscillibacter valericigenes Sjm18-20]